MTDICIYPRAARQPVDDENAEPDYYADGLDVNYRALSHPTKVATASDESWARHVATALNHWAAG